MAFFMIQTNHRAPITGPLYRFAFEHASAFRVVQAPGRIVFVLGPIVALGLATAMRRFEGAASSLRWRPR